MAIYAQKFKLKGHIGSSLVGLLVGIAILAITVQIISEGQRDVSRAMYRLEHAREIDRLESDSIYDVFLAVNGMIGELGGGLCIDTNTGEFRTKMNAHFASEVNSPPYTVRLFNNGVPAVPHATRQRCQAGSHTVAPGLLCTQRGFYGCFEVTSSSLPFFSSNDVLIEMRSHLIDLDSGNEITIAEFNDVATPNRQVISYYTIYWAKSTAKSATKNVVSLRSGILRGGPK